MPSLRYAEIDVSEELLAERQKSFDEAPPEKKMGLWYAKRHFVQLHRYRSQGLHFNYLSGPNAHHCTCGLVVLDGSEGMHPAILVSDAKHHGLDIVQSYRQHRNLLGQSEFSIALIIDHRFSWERKLDQFNGFCQGCGKKSGFVSWKAAAKFCRIHDANCGFGDIS